MRPADPYRLAYLTPQPYGVVVGVGTARPAVMAVSASTT